MLDLDYSGIGSALPHTITTLVLHLLPMPSNDLWNPNTHGLLLEQFLRNFAGPGRPLREIELRTRINLLSFTDIPDALLKVDKLLSSEELFPSFQEFRVEVTLRFPEHGWLKYDFEKKVGRAFPSLNGTGRVIVECTTFRW